MAPPPFDAWVRSCVSRGVVDTSDPDPLESDLPTLAHYLTRLFESPAWLADTYTDDELGKLVWYIFGAGSGYLSLVRHGPLPADVQVRCIAGVATMYTDLFDKVCGTRGTDPDEDLLNTAELDGAVYMIWDMDCLEGTILFPHQRPHLVDPAIGVLTTILDRCRTSTCLISALHAIGHAVGFHSRSGNPAVGARLQALADDFLGRRRGPQWVRDYALAARNGMVQ